VKEALRRDKEPLETLKRLENLPTVPLVLLSQPKKHMLISESLIVDGENRARLNRIDASYYTSLWLRREYMKHMKGRREEYFSKYKSVVDEIVRALIAYAPKSNGEKIIKECLWKVVCAIRSNKRLDKKRLLYPIAEWIVKRTSSYVPCAINMSVRDMSRLVVENFQEELFDLIKVMVMSVEKEEHTLRPSCNPLLGIQDFFRLDEEFYNTYESAGETRAGCIEDFYSELKKFIDGAIGFLNILEKVKLDRASSIEAEHKYNQIKTVTDEVFFVYAHLPLKFDKPYDIFFKQLQHFSKPLWGTKGGEIELNLNESLSNHVEVRVEEGALSFARDSNKEIEVKDCAGKQIANVPVEKVFGRVHVETERCRHFYTTKDFVPVKDTETGRILNLSRIEIPIRVRVSLPTKMAMTLILIGAVALSLAMCVFANLNVLVGGLGIYTVFLGIALFPKEHYLTLKLLKPHLWVLLSIAFVGILGGVVFFVLSKLNVLLPLMELMIKWLDP